MADKSKWRLGTQTVHAGELRGEFHGSVVLPIFQGASYRYEAGCPPKDLPYIRLNNSPNHTVLHNKIAQIESAEAAIVTSSGMAAITTTLLTLLQSGDHMLCQKGVYGGTHAFLQKDLTHFGMSFSWFDANNPASWEQALQPNTRLIYFETMSNPLLEVPNVEAIVAFAKRHKLYTIIDGTFASPINFRSAEWGVDLTVHSCSKYINGHSDLVAGAVVGRADLVDRVLNKLNLMGGSLDPHTCFLLQRGLKTLALRMKQHNESALRIAQFLYEHPAVTAVHYPGLPSHPQHKQAEHLLDGYGGMISFTLGNVDAMTHFMERCQLPVTALSLGGVESLMSVPAQASHATLSAQERLELGITDDLVRLSVGIEDTQDLLDDLAQALEPAPHPNTKS